MENKEIINGLDEIGLWICELTKIYDETKTTDDNRHIKYFYKILDEVIIKLKLEIQNESKS